MSTPRLEIDLSAIEHNTRVLVEALAKKGIQVLGTAKGAAAIAPVALAMLRGGAVAIGDSRVENLERLASRVRTVPFTLLRSPLLSQIPRVVSIATASLNTERTVLERLDAEAQRIGVRHEVVLMVELGDLREGIAPEELAAAAAFTETLRGLHLRGIGTNLACHSGVMPSAASMAELSRLAELVEHALGHSIETVSGGNSANLSWALSEGGADRVNELRLGETLLLGTEPLTRIPFPGLHTRAFTLFGEVIEVRDKTAQAPDTALGGLFGPRMATGTGRIIRQAIVALGEQDTSVTGLRPPEGFTVLGMSSDHLVLEVNDHVVSVGDELAFGLAYAGVLRASASPIMPKIFVSPRGAGSERHRFAPPHPASASTLAPAPASNT